MVRARWLSVSEHCFINFTPRTSIKMRGREQGKLGMYIDINARDEWNIHQASSTVQQTATQQFLGFQSAGDTI